MFKGTFTALVTPFSGGKVEAESYQRLIEKQIEAGIEGIVPVGTTGESPTLTHEEHYQVIELAVKYAQKKTLVIAGTGSNSTAEALDTTVAAEQMGADAALMVAPYYNKPSQSGLYEHFMAVASKVKIPIILYSIPGRCGVEIAVDTVVRLAKDSKNIVGIKEAGGSVDRVSQLRQVLPESFYILSGDDALTLPFMSVGACGVISVATNIIPKQIKEMVDLILKGDYAKAETHHRKLYPIFRDLFVETNPVPIKTAMAVLGWIKDEVRLPLAPLAPASKEKLLSAMRAVGLNV